MEQKSQQEQRKQLLRKSMFLLFFILITGQVTWWLWPYIMELQDPAAQLRLKEWINNFGPWGWLLLLVIQVLQIVIAVIPGEPVEVVSGLLYGAFGGLLLCEVGILIGSCLVYFGVRRFGKPFVRLFIKEEEISQYRFLRDERKLEAVVFLLFLLPGTPKDALTYLVPMTPLPPSRFFLIATFARIPSVITSTWAGATIATGNLWASVLIFVVIGIIGLCGIVFQKYYLEKMDHLRQLHRDHKAARKSHKSEHDES